MGEIKYMSYLKLSRELFLNSDSRKKFNIEHLKSKEIKDIEENGTLSSHVYLFCCWQINTTNKEIEANSFRQRFQNKSENF